MDRTRVEGGASTDQDDVPYIRTLFESPFLHEGHMTSCSSPLESVRDDPGCEVKLTGMRFFSLHQGPSEEGNPKVKQLRNFTQLDVVDCHHDRSSAPLHQRVKKGAHLRCMSVLMKATRNPAACCVTQQPAHARSDVKLPPLLLGPPFLLL